MTDLAVLRAALQGRGPFSRQLNRPVTLVAAAVVGFVSIPLVYIFIRAATAGSEVWLRLVRTRLLDLLVNTALLAGAVTLGTLLLGVCLAYLTERTDLPGRHLWRWLLSLPLAIPPYIGAVVHVALLRPRGGTIPQFLAALFERPVHTPSPFGFWGAVFMLTLFMYPYVYLLSAAAFQSIHAALEEAARSAGRSPWRAAWEVTLPMLKPAMGAGALLVALDILAEYGTVALLRYETFSAAIFLQLSGRYDRSAAAILSAVLVGLALLLLWAEVKVQGRARFYQIGSHWRPAPVLPLGAWRLPALALVGGVVSMSLLVPVSMLVIWTSQALSQPHLLATSFRTGSLGLWSYTWNSLWSSGLAALLAVLLSLPVAYLAARYPRPLTRAFSRLSQVGYALPGVVVALSLILMVNRFLPLLYATPMVVVIAYVLRHMPQAVRSSQSALAQVSPSLEEAAQTLGRNSVKAFIQVTLPLILPGLFAGGALVFLTSLKELPATLLLRPAGFETLAVRVWIWSEEGIFTQAAPAALLLILAAAGPLYFFLNQNRKDARRAGIT